MNPSDDRFSAAQEALAICIATHTPVFLWGEPGVGKTSIVQQIVAAYRAQHGWDADSFPFETIVASIHDPADFGGYPSPDHATGVVRRLPIDWAVNVAGKRGVVFFDEFSTAPPAVQAATLRVLEERVIGPLDIGPRVSFVLAGNPLGSAAGGWEFSPAMSRRFVHLIWEPSADYVITGFLQGFPPVTIPDLAAIALEDDESTAEFTRLRRPFEFDPAARGLVAGFLSAHRTAYLRVPEQGIHASHAWPNPAAWERVMLLLSAAKQAGASQQARDLLVYGSVGDGAGAEFVQYATYDDLPDAEALLADPDCFSFEQVSGDKVFVILGSVCAAVVDRNSIERWAAAWRVTARAADAYSPGQAALAARILSMNKPPGDVVAPPEVRVFMPMLRAAGLLGA